MSISDGGLCGGLVGHLIFIGGSQVFARKMVVCFTSISEIRAVTRPFLKVNGVRILFPMMAC